MMTILDINNLSSLMHNAGLALLTILIPFAIAIIVDLLQNKRNSNMDFFSLDINTILDHVFHIKRLLYSTGLIFIMPLFWEVSTHTVRAILLVLWLVGLFFISKTILDLYGWIKGKTFDFKMSYLNKLEVSHEDMVPVWNSVWEATDINYHEELKYFKVFSSKIDIIIQRRDFISTTHELLYDYSYHINNRSINLHSRSIGSLSKILEWHMLLWEKAEAEMESEEDVPSPDYGELSWILDQILKRLYEIILGAKSPSSFFKTLKKHASKTSNSSYLKWLLCDFYNILFEQDEQPDKYNIWRHYYPKEWKITKANLENQNNQIPPIAWEAFKQWASNAINSPVKSHNKQFVRISRELFPEVDQIDWGYILVFILIHCKTKQRVKYIIEKDWNLVLISDSFGRRRNTLELASILFADVFTVEKTESIIKDLQRLEYENGSITEIRRRAFLDIFSSMLKYLKNE